MLSHDNKKHTAILYMHNLQKFFINFFTINFKEILLKCKIAQNFEIEIWVPMKYLYPLLYFLKYDSSCKFEYLTDIVVADFTNKENRFLINYLLLNIYNYRIRVSTQIKEFTTLLSVISLYNSALWCEREIFDFFGIFFIYNHDLRRILTDYGFKGFALRKDFPLSGYIELYYDDNEKKITFKKIDFTQEFKNFIFRKTWI